MEGFITWQSDGQQTARLGTTAVWPDTDPTVGSGVGQRSIPEELMVSLLPLQISLPKLTSYTKSIALNLGISGEFCP
jgi:hypothetical protein